MRTSPFLPVLLATFGMATFSVAQTPPAPAPKNLVRNGSFETGFRLENLWDGVDVQGSLVGQRGGLPVLTTGGTIQESAMPVSVSVADLNGDGLLDIAAMDVIGYLRIYFNSGTKTEPKFTVGELASLFLSRVDPTHPSVAGITSKKSLQNIRQGQRIFLSDITRSGKKDLVIGNYFGEVMLVPNAGSGVRPDFRQPANISQVLIPTMKDPTTKWANVLSPVTSDWNRDGKDDVLVGEGSYSANAIHLLVNSGSGARPVLDEGNRDVLAYGMGLEQLSVAVEDYNGDGAADLLVTERTGKIAVYLNDGKPWQKGQPLKFSAFIPIGGVTPPPPATGSAQDPMDAAKATGLLSLGGITTIATGDFNGDGLFDLVFGKSNGRIALALNSGTKAAPKFAAPLELKGDANTPAFSSPSGWECDYGLERGNFYGFLSVVKADADPAASPQEGTAVLKAGYAPSPNKILAIPSQYTPGYSNWNPENSGRSFLFDTAPANSFSAAPANAFTMKQDIKLVPGKTYQFSMKVKGSKVSSAAVYLGLRGEIVFATRETRGDRDSVQVQNDSVKVDEYEVIKFSPSTAWSEVKKEFSLKIKDPRAAKAAEAPKLPDGSTLNSAVGLSFELSPGSGELYIDDLKVIEK